MYDSNYFERHANETLADARDFMARERLTRHGGTLEVGHMPGWLLAALVIIFIGMLLLAL